VRCIQCDVFSAMYSVRCIQCDVFSAMYLVRCIQCDVFSVMYIVKRVYGVITIPAVFTMFNWYHNKLCNIALNHIAGRRGSYVGFIIS